MEESLKEQRLTGAKAHWGDTGRSFPVTMENRDIRLGQGSAGAGASGHPLCRQEIYSSEVSAEEIAPEPRPPNSLSQALGRAGR